MNRRTITLTAILTLLPALAGTLLWSRLPDRIPTHFNIHGVPDSWSGKPFAVWFLPLFLVGIHLLCVFAVRLDPKQRNVSEKVLGLVLWICPAVSLMTAVMMYGTALGYAVGVNRVGTVFLGVLLLAVGNYLPKCRQNYTVGIKVPWTLADEDNWNRTHRLAGPLWMAAGGISLLSACIGGGTLWAAIAAAVLAALIPIVYSAALYLRKEKGA